MSFSATSLTLGGAANLIRETKAALGTNKLPRVSASPDADNRPALRPVKEGEGEQEDPAKVAESLGWHFVNFEANGGEVYQSLIRDEQGAPTQMWSVQQHGGKYPTDHPEGWNAQMLYYNDGVPIKAEAVVDLLERMPYANNFALAVQDIRDAQAISEADRKDAADAIPIPELVLPMSPDYTPSSPAYTSMYEPTSPHYVRQQQPMMVPMQPPMVQAQQPMMVSMQPPMVQAMSMQPPMVQAMSMQQPMMVPMQQPMMVPMQQPMMVPMQQPMMMVQSQQQPPPPSTTGAKAAELIEAQLHPDVTETGSMLDVAPEVKPSSSSSTSEPPASESSEGKRVIKLS
jgi:hypothetical protein